MPTRLESSLIAALFLLSACGGSGGSSSVQPGPSSTPPPASLKLTGIVATGKAETNIAVQAKCKTGNGSATTANDGSYQISITGGELPCVLEAATSSGYGKLHSAAAGSGLAAQSNVTPLTELLVARLIHAQPSTLFDGSTTALPFSEIDSSSVKTAAADVITTLLPLATTAVLKDFLTTPFTAATSTTTGDRRDQVLDHLKTKASSSQYAALLEALAGTSNTADIAKDFAAQMHTQVVTYPVAFKELLSVVNTPAQKNQQIVVTDSQTWAQVWAENISLQTWEEHPLPALDFSRQTAVGIIQFLGMTCRHANIVNAYRIGEKVFVEYQVSGRFCQALTTYPGVFASIDIAGYEVEFIALPALPSE